MTHDTKPWSTSSKHPQCLIKDMSVGNGTERWCSAWLSQQMEAWLLFSLAPALIYSPHLFLNVKPFSANCHEFTVKGKFYNDGFWTCGTTVKADSYTEHTQDPEASVAKDSCLNQCSPLTHYCSPKHFLIKSTHLIKYMTSWWSTLHNALRLQPKTAI